MAAYVALIVAMAAATLIGQGDADSAAQQHAAVYGTWWFTLLWAALAVAGAAYFASRHIRRLSVVLLHAAFVVILAGALTTHLTAKRGIVHLRLGEVVSTCMASDGSHDGVQLEQLPYSMALDGFEVVNHKGTTAASDYVSRFTIIDGKSRTSGQVSMNHIFSYKHTRIYQTSYDDDMRGTYLTLNRDPWGIGITYTGYALLLVALVMMLLDSHGTFHSLLRNPLLKKGALALIIAAGGLGHAQAATTVPQAQAQKFSKLFVLYNGRICPFQTFALDFTKKLHGTTGYGGLTAEQVVLGWVLWGNDWDGEPVIKVKSEAMREAYGLPKMASMRDFFDRSRGGYILGRALDEYRRGNTDGLHKAVADIDAKLQLVMQLRQGEPLKMFPVTGSDGRCQWIAPSDSIPAGVPEACTEMVRRCFGVLNSLAHSGNYGGFGQMVGQMRRYQGDFGGDTLPAPYRAKAELVYNSFPFATVLFVFNLLMGIAAFAVSMWRMTRSGGKKWAGACLAAAMAVSFAALTVCEGLRWVVSGTVPMANGYETMLALAWLVQLCALAVWRRFRIALAFGFLLSGLFLLVSHLGEMDPMITPLMPVLSSPLLSVHVGITMVAFALLSMTFVCGLTALALNAAGHWRGADTSQQVLALQLLSRLMLYPALAALAAGIFIGAVWANVSWGQYWGWDPKETWALITLMVYAIAAHPASLPRLARPVAYHTFMACAFALIVMTYFGVNYFLGGMHSYA